MRIDLKSTRRSVRVCRRWDAVSKDNLLEKATPWGQRLVLLLINFQLVIRPEVQCYYDFYGLLKYKKNPLNPCGRANNITQNSL